MAALPCTACQMRTPYPNSGAYCHLWGSGDQRDFRLRLCPTHIRALQHDLAEHELAPINDTPSIIDTPTKCFSCGQPVDQIDWHFSVTAYPAKDDREDYWTRLHIDCRLPLWAQNGQPLM